MAIDESRWQFVVTALDGSTGASGTGRITNPSQKVFSYHLNGGKTAQFTINIDNPVADFLLTNDALIKLYRRHRTNPFYDLLMVGDVIHVEESGQGDVGLITVVAADPWWRLQRRMIGTATDSNGRGQGYAYASVTAQQDYSQIVLNILDTAIITWPIGLQVGTVTNCGTSGFIDRVYFQLVGDLIQQLCSTLGGPEFEIVPIEPVLSGGTGFTHCLIGTVNIVPAIGQFRSNTVFEYGVGLRNVATYDRILSKDGLANGLYSLPQGFPSVAIHGDNVITPSDTTTQLASMQAIGLYQDVVPGDLVSNTLRQELVDEYFQVRRQARQQITVTPTVDCPMDYLTDYNVGDTVIVRAFANGTYRFNGTARIYGIDLALDDNDAESPTLLLIPG